MPFIEGIARLAGDTEAYHANFYDKSSFAHALNCLCKTKFENTIVYVAAHGFKKKISNIDIVHLLCEIGARSKECNITGVMLGSCYVGGNTTELEVCLTGNNIRWIAGYSSSSEWLIGTMIDCAIITKMLGVDELDYDSADQVIEHFGHAVSPFSKTYAIGDDYNENPTSFEESLQVVIQPTGKGYNPRTVSKEVFAAYSEYQK